MHLVKNPVDNSVDRRKYKRVPTNSTTTYILVANKFSKIGVGTGTVINISQSGLMLQTDHKITSNYIYLVYQGIDKKLVPMIGKVVFSKMHKEGIYRTGISFRGEHKDNVEFRKNLIRVFHNEYVIESLMLKKQ